MTSPVPRPDPIVKALQGAFARGAQAADLLVLAVAKIREACPVNTEVYAYRRAGSRFELTAQEGRPTAHTQVAPNAHTCMHHATTRSTIVAPIRRRDDLLGRLDVISDGVDAFDAATQDSVRAVADALAVLL